MTIMIVMYTFTCDLFIIICLGAVIFNLNVFILHIRFNNNIYIIYCSLYKKIIIIYILF